MSTPKGYSSQTKLDRLKAEFATVEPIRAEQHGLSVNAHMYVYEVGTDAVEAGSTVQQIAATAHAALKGDVIRITSGALSGTEIKVSSITSNAITLCEDLAAAPAAAVTFQILRHKYPVVDAAGNITVAISPSPVLFTRNGSNQTVIEDTVTPANDRPLPVKLSAPIPTGSSVIGAVTQSGAWNVTNVSGTVSLPTGAATETTLAAINTKTLAAGQAAMAASSPVVIASNQSAIPVTAASLPLPTGAATEAKQPALGTAGTASANVITVQGIASMTALVVNGSAVTQPVSAASLPLPTGAATETTLSTLNGKVPSNLTVTSTRLLVDASGTTQPVSGTVAATQSGTWSTRTQDGAGNLITSTLTGSLRGSHVNQLGRSVVTTVRNVYSSTSVTSGAWVQLVASTSAEIHELEIFDSSGETLEIGTGAAASEARLILVFPGGNGRIPVRIAATTRLSIRAVSATASVGEISINCYGV